MPKYLKWLTNLDTAAAGKPDIAGLMLLLSLRRAAVVKAPAGPEAEGDVAAAVKAPDGPEAAVRAQCMPYTGQCPVSGWNTSVLTG